jgi:hypothetical protein
VAFRPLGLLLVALLVVASACSSSHRPDEPWTVQSISPDGRIIARGQADDTQATRLHLDTALDLAQRYVCALVEQRAAELTHQL